MIQRMSWVVWAAVLVCLGCGQPVEEPDGLRPPIEPREVRCGAAELVDFGRAERILALPGGRLAIVGNAFDRFREPLGRILILDPTGELPPEQVTADFRFNAVDWARDAFFVARLRPLLFRVPVGDEAERISVLHEISDITARDLLVQGDGSLVFGATDPDGWASVPVVVRLGADGEVVWMARFTDREDRIVLSGHMTSVVQEANGDFIATGGGRRDAADQGRVNFIYRIDPDDGAIVSQRIYEQQDFEALRLITDTAGRAYALAVTGHQGNRYVTDKPLFARIAADGSLFDRLTVPLPEGTAHGALLAAAQTEDGWVLGGSACGEGRVWCAGWLVRVVDGEVVWSRVVHRDSAAAVTDIALLGRRIVAVMSSSAYCCEYYGFDADAWLWELELDGSCPAERVFDPDGVLLR